MKHERSPKLRLFPLQVGMLVNGQIGQGFDAFLQRYEQFFQLSLLRLDEIHFCVQVFLVQFDSFQCVIQLRDLQLERKWFYLENPKNTVGKLFLDSRLTSLPCRR